MLLFAGSTVVLISVFLGFAPEGGHILALWHPTEVMIICGAALGGLAHQQSVESRQGLLAGAVAPQAPAPDAAGAAAPH